MVPPFQVLVERKIPDASNNRVNYNLVQYAQSLCNGELVTLLEFGLRLGKSPSVALRVPSKDRFGGGVS